MSSKQTTVDYVLDHIRGVGEVTSRKMFGEYAIYCEGKVVALVCDDQLFVKPTPGARAFLKNPEEAPPYPGAKPYFLIDAGRWEDHELLSELIKIVAAEVPLPKKKTKRRVT